ncbi:hypothetical protein LRS73_02840 [Methylobacterium currus]|uniref:hypothetical protein n=1 Tax=Methylobacterium currus TaxID=2051553 RepID=UPI001E5379ED|nr:hypothetical protein [Methylobacterium currus]UHC16876.1 hypothetical protein LRS73_02840 [Methylobacterium currus]
MSSHGPRLFHLAAFTLVAVAPAVLAATEAVAQAVPATNDVANCTLIADPTAQRLCLESARQSRPAATFDPTAQKQRAERRPPPGRDALSPVPKATGGAGAKPAATSPESYRETKWRLQIP